MVFMPDPNFAPVELLSSSDGGKTFQIITPPQASVVELFFINGIVVRTPASLPISMANRKLGLLGGTRGPKFRASARASLGPMSRPLSSFAFGALFTPGIAEHSRLVMSDSSYLLAICKPGPRRW